MSVQYLKVGQTLLLGLALVGSFLPLQGQFVLAANFNSTYKYDLYPNRGTDSGVCLTVRPMVDFRQELFSPKDKDGNGNGDDDDAIKDIFGDSVEGLILS